MYQGSASFCLSSVQGCLLSRRQGGTTEGFSNWPMLFTSWHGPLQKLTVSMSSRTDSLKTETFLVWLHFLLLGLDLPGSPGKAPIQFDRFPGRKSQVSEHLTEIWVSCCHAHLSLECTGEHWVLSWPAVTLAGLIGSDLWPLLVFPYFACPAPAPCFLSC